MMRVSKVKVNDRIDMRECHKFPDPSRFTSTLKSVDAGGLNLLIELGGGLISVMNSLNINFGPVLNQYALNLPNTGTRWTSLGIGSMVLHSRVNVRLEGSKTADLPMQKVSIRPMATVPLWKHLRLAVEDASQYS